jgi:hypothetical protein
MTALPVNLTTALACFEEVYSPRIAARTNDDDVRIAHTPGEAILMFEPTGTVSTGDRHEGALPAGVDRTTGHQL